MYINGDIFYSISRYLTIYDIGRYLLSICRELYSIQTIHDRILLAKQIHLTNDRFISSIRSNFHDGIREYYRQYENMECDIFPCSHGTLRFLFDNYFVGIESEMSSRMLIYACRYGCLDNIKMLDRIDNDYMQYLLITALEYFPSLDTMTYLVNKIHDLDLSYYQPDHPYRTCENVFMYYDILVNKYGKKLIFATFAHISRECGHRRLYKHLTGIDENFDMNKILLRRLKKITRINHVYCNTYIEEWRWLLGNLPNIVNANIYNILIDIYEDGMYSNDIDHESIIDTILIGLSLGTNYIEDLNIIYENDKLQCILDEYINIYEEEFISSLYDMDIEQVSNIANMLRYSNGPFATIICTITDILEDYSNTYMY